MQFGISSFLQIAVVGMVCAIVAPVMAEEDATKITGKTTFSATAANTGDNSVKHYIQIGNAKVQIVLNAGNAFIVVREGGPLNLTYADGSPMCSIPTGQGIQASGFLGGGSGLTVNVVNGVPTLALAPAEKLSIALGNKGNAIEFKNGDGTTTKLTPGGKGEVAAKVTTFKDGETVSLKEGQIGKIAGSNLIAFGNNNGGLSVTTNSQSATISGAGQDKVVLGQNALLNITSGNLKVSGGNVLLVGNVEMKNDGGSVTFQHAGTNYPLKVGQSMKSNAPQSSTPPGNNNIPPATAVRKSGGTVTKFNLELAGFDPTVVLGSFNNNNVSGNERDQGSVTGS